MATKTSTKSDSKSEIAKAAEKKSDPPTEPPLGKGTEGIPAPPKTKDEVRLFQRTGDEKVWLTKEQATSEGFYWNDHPENV